MITQGTMFQQECLLLVVLLASGYSSGQGSNSAPASQEERNAEAIPVHRLEFADMPPIPGAPNSPVFISPILCSDSGVPFVDFPQPPDYMAHAVFALEPRKSVQFSTASIPNLYDISFKGYFLSASGAGLLVRATTDSRTSRGNVTIVPGLPARPIYPGAHSDFIIQFEADGRYKTAIKLTDEYEFWKVASLSDSRFVGIAYDRQNAVARVFLLDDAGQIIRRLSIPSSMEAEPKLKAGETGPETKRVEAASSLSWWLIVPSRGKLVLYLAHRNGSVLEIGADGSVRELSLESPPGFVIDGMVSANDRWLVRYRKNDISATEIDTRSDAENFALYEVDPSLGTLKKKLVVVEGSLFDIACEHDGVVTAMTNTGEKILLKAAEIGR